MHGVASTDTIDIIRKSQVLPGKKITNASFVCDHRPLKSEPWRVCCIVGGDKLPYADDPSSTISSLLDTQITINSTISDALKGARFPGDGLKILFLGSFIKNPEFMRIPLSIFPAKIPLSDTTSTISYVLKAISTSKSIKAYIG